MSQSQVAAGVGVTPSVISQWERGFTIPTVPTFAGLVALLGTWPLLTALLPPDQLAGALLHATAQSSTSQVPLGQCIRAARQAAGLTQTQLGTRVGVRQSSVGQWEGGRTLPTLPMLRRLVAVLGPWPLLEPLVQPPTEPRQQAGTWTPWTRRHQHATRTGHRHEESLNASSSSRAAATKTSPPTTSNRSA